MEGDPSASDMMLLAFACDGAWPDLTELTIFTVEAVLERVLFPLVNLATWATTEVFLNMSVC